MPKHLSLWIMWSLQQDYRQIVFMVFLWQMGKLPFREAGQQKGEIYHKAVETGQSDTLVLIQWVIQRFQCAEEWPAVYSKCSFLKLILKGPDELALEQLREMRIYDKAARWFSHRWSANHMSTGELQMTQLPSCGFSLHPPSLVEEGNATWGFWHLSCCQERGCPLLASCFQKQFLNSLSTHVNLRALFEPLALECTLRVQISICCTLCM